MANMIHTQKGILGPIYRFVKLGNSVFLKVNDQSIIGLEVSPGIQEDESCNQINLKKEDFWNIFGVSDPAFRNNRRRPTQNSEPMPI